MEHLAQIEEEIRAKQKSIKYDLRNYSITHIVESFQNGGFYIPLYQRNFVWNKKIQSRFIESLILGLPTSSLTIAYTDDFRAEIIDGVQRVKTIESFVNGDLMLDGLDDLAILNGIRFNTLPKSQQRKFLSRSISVIALSEEMSHEFRLELFERMNLGSSIKTSHEMRQALLNGPFIELVRNLSENELFESSINITPFMRSRKDHEEFVIKFFCFSNDLSMYRGNMNKFLDACVKKYNENLNENEFVREFERTTIFVNKYFKELFYKNKKRFSKSLFDSIYVGVNLALREEPNLSPRYMDWINHENFEALTKVHANQTSKRIKERIMFVKNALLKEY